MERPVRLQPAWTWLGERKREVSTNGTEEETVENLQRELNQ